jgi:hypothetical protein
MKIFHRKCTFLPEAA